MRTTKDTLQRPEDRSSSHTHKFPVVFDLFFLFAIPRSEDHQKGFGYLCCFGFGEEDAVLLPVLLGFEVVVEEHSILGFGGGGEVQN